MPEYCSEYTSLTGNEVTFEETQAHPDIETQRKWSDKAIARTTPLLMGLFSFVTLVAFNMHQTKVLVSMEIASCCDKPGDLLALIALRLSGDQFGQIYIFQSLTISLIRLNTQKKHRYIDLSTLYCLAIPQCVMIGTNIVRKWGLRTHSAIYFLFAPTTN
ncbi:hypothetical protein [Legionella pneumophila]|uniref:hypothetical protein n=1 Tax=Legionella pneumophila TaxID=446 RepID=UPI000750AD48|nr:hypothetical protein [Legionella pneumophila]HDS3847712.1 hypothetical protein [Legionella pneumophila]HDS3850573.1 hypothetical protein [Legionella pneumophila]